MTTSTRTAGIRHYELTNHLGNVSVIVSDKKLLSANQSQKLYLPEVISYQDYYPFGMVMTDRSGSLPNVEYRYGYNGKENDNEVKGESNQQDYGFRVYDPRVGRFLSVDPLMGEMPEWSPYNYTFNSPINLIDPLGLSPESPGDPPCKDCAASVVLPEITITAQRKKRNYDQTTERYGYNGSWNQYQKDYKLTDWSFDNYHNYYNQFHRKNFNKYVAAQDKAEADRVAVEKMMFWWGVVFPSVTSVLSPYGGGEPINGMYFKSPQYSNFRYFKKYNHFTAQLHARGVSYSQYIDALEHALLIKSIKFDTYGRPSQMYIGNEATAIINPRTKKFITVWKTGTKIRNRFLP